MTEKTETKSTMRMIPLLLDAATLERIKEWGKAYTEANTGIGTLSRAATVRLMLNRVPMPKAAR